MNIKNATSKRFVSTEKFEITSCTYYENVVNIFNCVKNLHLIILNFWFFWWSWPRFYIQLDYKTVQIVSVKQLFSADSTVIKNRTQGGFLHPRNQIFLGCCFPSKIKKYLAQLGKGGTSPFQPLWHSSPTILGVLEWQREWKNRP